MKADGLFGRFLAWIWLKAFDECLFSMRGNLRDMHRLNGCHCDFLQQLERDHPELNNEIDKHQRARFEALHPDSP